MPRILFDDLIACRERTGIGHYVAELRQLLPHYLPITNVSETSSGRPIAWLSRLYAQGSSRGGARTSLAGRINGLVGSTIKPARQWVQSHGFELLNRYMIRTQNQSQWDLYHQPDLIPHAIDAPTLVTAHDLSVVLYPEWHPAHRVRKFEENLRKGMERVAHFIAVSHHTRDDLCRVLGIAPERIDVVPLAPRAHFLGASPGDIQSVRQKFSLPGRYLLFVGTLEPRKNVANLLRAYRDLSPKLRAKVPLVLAGGWGWNAEEIRAELAHPDLTNSVCLTGYVSDGELAALTRGAVAMVYPSRYEGFGLPPIEAMACGTPVITTHCGSLKRVIGNAARIVEPDDLEDLTRAMIELITEPRLADQFRARGLVHVRPLTWQRTARETAAVYRRLLGTESVRRAA